MRKFAFILACGALLFQLACRKKDGGTTKVPETGSEDMMVLCEGNFNWGNASFDLYYPKDSNYVQDAWKKLNGSKPLGDVLQSGIYLNGTVWLVLNNSGKLVGIDAKTGLWKKEIKGLKSPRYATVDATGNLWVTDLYANAVTVIDPVAGTLLKTIPVNGWCEELLAWNGSVYAAGMNGMLYRFSQSGFNLTDSLQLYRGLRSLVLDNQQKLWAIASDSNHQYLCRVNPATMGKEWSTSLKGGQEASCLRTNKNKDQLWFLWNGIRTLSSSDTSISLFAAQGGQNFYGLGVHPSRNTVFVSDAADYVSAGSVVEYSAAGKVLHRFTAGIIPGGFVFFQ